MATTSDTSSSGNLPVSLPFTTEQSAVDDDGRNFRFEDYTQRAIIGSIVCVVCVCGLVGNTLVILAVILSRKLQTKTNVFVVNLAVADLVTCLCSPFTATALLAKEGWPLPDIVCSLSAAIGYMCIQVSILTLAAIALNRYVLITRPLQTFQTIYTPKKITVMLVITWLYPLLVSLLPVFGLGKWGYSEKYKTCSQDTSHEKSDYFSLVGSLLVYPTPLIILFVCYFKIYRHITQHTRRMTRRSTEVYTLSETEGPSSTRTSSTQQLRPASSSNVALTAGASTISKRNIKITKNLFLVMCAFIACLAPFAIALTIPPSDPAIPWTGVIIFFNSMINPIIYGLKHPHFKKVFAHMLRCQCRVIPEPSSILRRMTSQ